jgi:hypothetical protein
VGVVAPHRQWVEPEAAFILCTWQVGYIPVIEQAFG